MAEGSLEFLGVLAGLAEGEFQVHPIVGRGVSPCQLAAHRLDVGGGKAERLQIGEAPPGDRESGDQLETPAVRTDRFVLKTAGRHNESIRVHSTRLEPGPTLPAHPGHMHIPETMHCDMRYTAPECSTS